MYSHAPVESAKAINHHDLSSDWINLTEKKTTTKNIRNRICPIACGKHMWNKFHISYCFHGMFYLCAVKTYVENILWKPGLTHSYEGSSICNANVSIT